MKRGAEDARMQDMCAVFAMRRLCGAWRAMQLSGFLRVGCPLFSIYFRKELVQASKFNLKCICDHPMHPIKWNASSSCSVCDPIFSSRINSSQMHPPLHGTRLFVI